MNQKSLLVMGIAIVVLLLGLANQMNRLERHKLRINLCAQVIEGGGSHELIWRVCVGDRGEKK